MRTVETRIVGERTDELGEAPVWLLDRAELLRVDVLAGEIIVLDPASGAERRRLLDGPVGFALPAGDDSLVAGVGRELILLRGLDGAPEPLARVEPDLATNRFSDAVCDPNGRLWAGTLTKGEPNAALYRLEPGRAPEVAIADVTISNGMDFDRDATRLYYIDSRTRRIDAIDFDLDRGVLGARRPFVEIDPEDGLPDGLTVDAEGGIWVALFGGGAIRRYGPDGSLDEHLPLPVSNPTSLAFGGPALGDLYVTTARLGLSSAGLEKEPKAGSLFRLSPGIRGRRPAEFGASRGPIEATDQLDAPTSAA